MSYVLRKQEFDSLIVCSDSVRYEYTIKRIADWEEVWSLHGTGWVLAGEDGGREVVPIWPHSMFAQACATEQWANTAPKVISLTDWSTRWLPGLEGDQRLIAVFPISSAAGSHGTVVTPGRFREDLDAQLEQIE